MSSWKVLLLLALVSSVAPATLLIISGYITCRLPLPFKYRQLIIESDLPLGHDEYLYTGPGTRTQGSSHFYNITTQATDDGPFNGEYELLMEVHHTCNLFGQGPNYHRRVRFDLGSWSITHGTHHISYNMDLTDKGSWWPGALKEKISGDWNKEFS